MVHTDDRPRPAPSLDGNGTVTVRQRPPPGEVPALAARPDAFAQTEQLGAASKTAKRVSDGVGL